MDSNQFVSIFSFLLLFHHSQARTLPSPSPSPLFSPSPAPEPSNNGCWLQPNSCHNISLTACVDPSSTSSEEVILLVKNEGERSLTVNVSMLNGKAMAKHVDNTQIPPHRVKEIKISTDVGGNSSIQIEAKNMGCVIYLVSAASSGGILDYIPLPTHISPINGASLLILTGLIIGSCYACYKHGKRGDGTPYQQLEMAQPTSPNNVETARGWEQDWDDDWRQMANGSSQNGLSSRSTKRDD
ncbi:uncharacterized protein LOC120204660 [Hibiscus syriacus]|uniref:uncharacterized protein LOC120204660 n=1 Tax=Hibiscus syriacus TaxID=106335 RepID=UPI001920E945|nr:uncharacterized protein LOC120204660 [Hibiscus syriacus]